MGEKYTTDDRSGSELAQALLARLVPDVDAALLISALLDEAARAAGSAAGADTPQLVDADAEPQRELRRVRRQFALGEAARAAQHDLSNPLTALMAEVQLLELEAVGPEHRAAVRRIVELTRRVAAVARRLDVSRGSAIG
jgi:signal transduction histidine kinase